VTVSMTALTERTKHSAVARTVNTLIPDRLIAALFARMAILSTLIRVIIIAVGPFHRVDLAGSIQQFCALKHLAKAMERLTVLT
jgi:hypothetical protein